MADNCQRVICHFMESRSMNEESPIKPPLLKNRWAKESPANTVERPACHCLDAQYSNSEWHELRIRVECGLLLVKLTTHSAICQQETLLVGRSESLVLQGQEYHAVVMAAEASKCRSLVDSNSRDSYASTVTIQSSRIGCNS